MAHIIWIPSRNRYLIVYKLILLWNNLSPYRLTLTGLGLGLIQLEAEAKTEAKQPEAKAEAEASRIWPRDRGQASRPNIPD